jgi:hypothetical protein
VQLTSHASATKCVVCPTVCGRKVHGSSARSPLESDLYPGSTKLKLTTGVRTNMVTFLTVISGHSTPVSRQRTP